MPKIYNPQNEFGQSLIAAGQVRAGSTPKLDNSWLNIADNLQDSNDTDLVTAKIVADLSSELRSEIISSAGTINVKVVAQLPQTWDDEVKTTIYLIKNELEEGDNNYSEYVCINLANKDTDPAPKFEKLGHIEIQQATAQKLGTVKLSDTISESDVSAGVAVTPKAVHDVKTELTTSIEELQGNIETLHKIVKISDTVENGVLTISDATDNDVFVGAYVNNELFMPTVTRGEGTITIRFTDSGDNSITNATVYLSRPFSAE